MGTFVRVLDDDGTNWTKRRESLKFVKNGYCSEKKNEKTKKTIRKETSKHDEKGNGENDVTLSTENKMKISAIGVHSVARAHTRVRHTLRSHCASGGHTVWSTQNRTPLLLVRVVGDVISVLSMNIYSRIFPIVIVLCTSARTCRPPMHTCECLAPFATRNMLTWRLCASGF